MRWRALKIDAQSKFTKAPRLSPFRPGCPPACRLRGGVVVLCVARDVGAISHRRYLQLISIFIANGHPDWRQVDSSVFSTKWTCETRG